MSYKNFLREKPALCLSFLVMILLLILFPFLVGKRPALCQYRGQWYLPSYNSSPTDKSDLTVDLQLKANMDYHKLDYDLVLWPLIEQHPNRLMPATAWQKPGSKDQEGGYYLLGSYDLGRDLLSACLFGFRQSLLIALFALSLSGFFGLILGSFPVFQSQRASRLSLWSLLLISVSLVLVWTEGIFILESKQVRGPHLFKLVFLISVCTLFAYILADRKPAIRFSLDRLSLAYVELMKSIPGLLFLLLLVQIFIRPGFWSLGAIIAFLYLPVIINYSRSFCYRHVSESYIDALVTLGASPARIYVKHILPRLMADLLPVLSLGIANVILMEASLRFLGLGMALQEVSLGSILYAARANPSAWWTAVFPGMMLFWMVYSFNTFGIYLRNKQSLNELKR